jgi:hypothetical protein
VAGLIVDLFVELVFNAAGVFTGNRFVRALLGMPFTGVIVPADIPAGVIFSFDISRVFAYTIALKYDVIPPGLQRDSIVI